MKKNTKLSFVASAILATTYLQAVEDLGMITVTSGSFKTNENKAPFSTEIFTTEDILKSKAKDIYSFLNSQSSIIVMPSYGNTFAQKLDMRGYGLTDGYQNIAILIDGRKINNIDMTPQLLSSISLDNIEKIEITKGSGSVEFGDGATAGTINIMTNGKNTNFIKTYYGNNNSKYGALSLGHSNDKIIVNGYIDYSSTDGEKKDENYIKNKSLDIKFFPTNDLEFRAKRSFSNLNTKYAKSLTLAEYKDNILKDKGFTEQYMSSYVTSIGGSYFLSPKIEMSADFTDEDKRSDYPTWKSTYENQSFNSKIKIKNDSSQVAFGIDNIDGDRKQTGNKTTKENQGLFITTSYLIGNTFVSAGGRYEEVNYIYAPDSGTALEQKEYLDGWDIGINQSLNENQSIFANYNKAFQAPDIDRFFNYGGTFNAFINTAISKTFNIGFNDFRDNNKLKITVFKTNLTNEIYYYKTSYRNTNIDKSYKYGLELFDKYLINSIIYTSVNYSYIVAKIDTENEANGAYDGKNSPGVSKHNATLNLGTNFGNFSSLLSHTYRSKAYAGEDLANTFTQKQEAYNSTDISCEYKVGKNVEIFAKIQNLFDQKNGLWIKDDSIYPVNYFRNYYAGIKASF